jgi:archaellum biogenesis ATPase FlaH
MKDQIEFLTQQVKALQRELKRAKKLNQKLIDRIEVNEPEVVIIKTLTP